MSMVPTLFTPVISTLLISKVDTVANVINTTDSHCDEEKNTHCSSFFLHHKLDNHDQELHTFSFLFSIRISVHFKRFEHFLHTTVKDLFLVPISKMFT